MRASAVRCGSRWSSIASPTLPKTTSTPSGHSRGYAPAPPFLWQVTQSSAPISRTHSHGAGVPATPFTCAPAATAGGTHPRSAQDAFLQRTDRRVCQGAAPRRSGGFASEVRARLPLSFLSRRPLARACAPRTWTQVGQGRDGWLACGPASLPAVLPAAASISCRPQQFKRLPCRR